MKRLTGRKDGRAYIVGCPDFALPKIAGLIIQQTVDRLAAIEDILGDEYDLDWLQVIMDAEQHGGLIVGYGPGDPGEPREPGEPGELGVMEEVAADNVEVVRCRDCKWFNHYTMECESDDVATDHEGGASFSINFGPDDFCSYGQRKIETVLPKSDAKDESGVLDCGR